MVNPPTTLYLHLLSDTTQGAPRSGQTSLLWRFLRMVSRMPTARLFSHISDIELYLCFGLIPMWALAYEQDRSGETGTSRITPMQLRMTVDSRIVRRCLTEILRFVRTGKSPAILSDLVSVGDVMSSDTYKWTCPSICAWSRQAFRVDMLSQRGQARH